jgi:predicted HTH domain antitoxin
MSATLHFDWEVPEAALEEPFKSELIDTIKRETVLQLFAEGKIGSGYGAKMLGITRWEFLEILGQRKIPITSYGPGELDEERATIQELLRERQSRDEGHQQ